MMLSGCQTLSVIDVFTSQNDAEERVDVQNIEQLSLENNSQQQDYYYDIAQELYELKKYHQVYKIARKLSAENHYKAQYLLGYLLFYGQGVPQNKKVGIKWLTLSANSGYRPAIEALVMIEHGLWDSECVFDDKKEASQEGL